MSLDGGWFLRKVFFTDYKDKYQDRKKRKYLFFFSHLAIGRRASLRIKHHQGQLGRKVERA